MMPPTDKALLVVPAMTEDHCHWLREACHLWYGGNLETFLPPSVKHLRDIESVVRYLVDHPERLAGEGQVVVKREELENVCDELSLISTEPAHNVDWMVDGVEKRIRRWLAGSPTAQESNDG